jgi:PAS domain S-box-containing protein
MVQKRLNLLVFPRGVKLIVEPAVGAGDMAPSGEFFACRGIGGILSPVTSKEVSVARSAMTIGSRFNLILILLFIVLMTINALDDYHRQQTLAIQGAVDHARILARQIIETRNYLSAVAQTEPAHNENLIPQVAASRIAKLLSSDSKYLVRQVSLRFRNPANRPDAYEQRVLQALAAGSRNERYEVVTEHGDQVFRYLLPMVAEKSCLECHGSYDHAPLFVQQRFDRGHPSYGYHEGEIIGAVSIAIPMVELYRLIGVNLKSDLLLGGMSFLVVLAGMGWLVQRAIIRPIRQLSASISRVTATGTFSERLPVRGDDEVGQLFVAFNALMTELEGKTAQSDEATARFRNLIEMSQSAIVTFMADGKVVSVNQKAETLFGLARAELLGESIFDYFAEGEHLRAGLATFEQTGLGGGVGETLRYRVRGRNRDFMDLEVALSVSMTEGRALYTMILRER